MKFLKLDGEDFVFRIGRREKNLLLDLLKLYPVVPVSHHRISDSTDSTDAAANQKLLEEALTEHRKENKQALEAMLSDANRFREVSGGYRLFLTAYQIEWLLQVLNDIRVGSWLLLGSPDEKRGKPLRLSLQNARHLWAMEVAGHFQHCLLTARNQS